MGMSHVAEPELERQGKTLGRSGGKVTTAGLLLALPGVVLLVVGLAISVTVVWAVGLAVLAIAGGPALIGATLLMSSAVSRWHARHRSFA